MTDQETFPTRGRVAILAFVLALASLVTTVAFAAPSKQDVEDAKGRLQQIKDELAGVERRLAAKQEEANAKAAAVEEAQGLLEATQTELQRTRAELARVQARYDRIRERLNDRAVDAYMTGPVSGLDFVLGAESVAELTDRLVYADALAQADAELATEVANLRNELTALQVSLERQREREAIELAEKQQREQEVLRELADIERLLAKQESLLHEARRLYRKLHREREEFLERFGGSTSGGPFTGALPQPYNELFEYCPVEPPRGFGDGFGAPRYGGGYHLHKGVDIVAPMGTEIVAPFDGYAYRSYNGLGGSVVFVVGAHGTVYNAHLSGYSQNSSGSVSAGDVIGYVGSTGDSSVPHDHFEFHPKVMPGNWPISAYGYSVIEDAVNPYPMLMQACF
jgi:murein DD-endopeptidase MepM/ murein hydrolase activator NlpD